MIAFAVLLLAAGQPASQPSSAPSGSAPGHASDVSAQVTMIVELSERTLSIQESWALGNRSGTTVPPAELAIATPDGAKTLRAPEDAIGFVAREDGRGIDLTEALGPSGRELSFSYLYDFSGSSAEIRRPIPFAVETLRLIVQDAPGLTVTANVPSDRRTRDLNGRVFSIYDMTGLRAGTHLELALAGLPSHTLWPRRAALAAAFGILGWMLWMLRRGSREPRAGVDGSVVSPLSASARRDQIVKAIEVLERELHEGKVKAKRFERRYRDLMHELSLALHEIEIEDRSIRGVESAREHGRSSAGGVDG